jgi:hypothetical protein
VINIWKDPVQDQILMEAMNFRDNATEGLAREFINRCKAEIIVIAPV